MISSSCPHIHGLHRVAVATVRDAIGHRVATLEIAGGVEATRAEAQRLLDGIYIAQSVGRRSGAWAATYALTRPAILALVALRDACDAELASHAAERCA